MKKVVSDSTDFKNQLKTYLSIVAIVIHVMLLLASVYSVPVCSTHLACNRGTINVFMTTDDVVPVLN